MLSGETARFSRLRSFCGGNLEKERPMNVFYFGYMYDTIEEEAKRYEKKAMDNKEENTVDRHSVLGYVPSLVKRHRPLLRARH